MADFRSIATTNFATSEVSSLVITKPAGLAVGDLMVAILSKSDTINSQDSDINTASGWTLRGERKFNDSEGELNIQTKVAASGDVAAGNFTFTTDNPCFVGGAIVAVSDPASGAEFQSIEMDSTGSVTVLSNTSALTPLVANTLIIVAIASQTGSDTTTSTFTSTPSITFTERADFVRDSAQDDPSLAIATGVHTGTAEITAYGATLSNAALTASSLILINPQVNATAAVSPMDVPPAINGVVATNNVVADVPHLAVEPTVNGLILRANNNIWRNPDKPTTNWNNLPK